MSTRPFTVFLALTRICVVWLCVSCSHNACTAAAATSKPNILFILADDLGYGDVSCYNSESKVATPNLDRLAREGMRFTDAHSPSTVCTPSRYSLLTGRMTFRIPYRGVFEGVDGPCLITADRLPDTAPDAPGQLYNLETDPGEKVNLYFQHPEIVKELKTLLEQSKTSGRSRPEQPAANP